MLKLRQSRSLGPRVQVRATPKAKSKGKDGKGKGKSKGQAAHHIVEGETEDLSDDSGTSLGSLVRADSDQQQRKRGLRTSASRSLPTQAPERASAGHNT